MEPLNNLRLNNLNYHEVNYISCVLVALTMRSVPLCGLVIFSILAATSLRGEPPLSSCVPRVFSRSSFVQRAVALRNLGEPFISGSRVRIRPVTSGSGRLLVNDVRPYCQFGWFSNFARLDILSSVVNWSTSFRGVKLLGMCPGVNNHKTGRYHVLFQNKIETKL